jgi:hypothetical protein
MKLKEGIIHFWKRKDTPLPMNDLYFFLRIARLPMRFYKHKKKTNCVKTKNACIYVLKKGTTINRLKIFRAEIYSFCCKADILH